MMFAGFLFLLLLTGGSTNNHTEPPDGEGVYNQSHLDRGSTYNYNDSDRDDDQDQKNGYLPSHCSYTNIVNHFRLTDKVKFYLTRPVRDYLDSTKVLLDIYLYSILDVRAKEQELVAYFWINIIWNNEYISWRPPQLCDMYDFTVPSELLWKPDLTIEEVIEKDKLFQTPYLTIRWSGRIYQRNGIVLISTCKMDFYRFPFDTQICNLTFKSIQHDAYQIQVFSDIPNEDFFNISRTSVRMESEWLLVNLAMESDVIDNFDFPISVLVYVMTIKRRSVLYVANFIVPILFFLCLDLASFLISESGGEKLSFKVTVLLAVTVMQLILNDILPSSSDRIPLIAVYCIGSFILMMLSLLETILMMYLMEKDEVSQDKEADKDQNLCDNFKDQRGKVQRSVRDMNKPIPRVRILGDPPAVKPPELRLKVKEGRSIQRTKEIHDSENLTEELMEVLKTMTLLLSNRKQENEPGYWTRMTKKLNRIYFVFYIIIAGVFLGYVFSVWLPKDTK